MARIILKPGREKPLLRRHPWVFSGAISDIQGNPQAGETVKIFSKDGHPLAVAAYSPHSQIRARVWSWDETARIGEDFFLSRLKQAIKARNMILDHRRTSAYRLIHGESDGIPGLIVDRYSDVYVVQFLSCGPEYWRETIIALLGDLTHARSIFDRSDIEVRKLEGLPLRAGTAFGDTPPARVQIQENDLSFWVDVVHGQKTGFFLDQRDNRQKIRQYALDRSVLDCFSYTGGFSIATLAGGANAVTAVDSSIDALDLGIKNLILNGYANTRVAWVQADIFHYLRELQKQGRKFGMVILDPPKFAPSAAQIQKAARGYKDINRLAFQLLTPGGLLATFSCSGGIGPDLFQKIVAGAALDAQVEAQIIDRMNQAPDHPIATNFPEGSYLKGLLCLVN